MATNKAAWLDEKDTPFRVGEAPMPDPGPDEIVIKNHAIAVNAVDWHMQESLIFVKDLPTVLGSDVAGEVHSVGKEVTKFKKGDRVGGHTINLVTGKPQDGAYAWYSVANAAISAHLPSSISFTDAAVLPLALEAATCGLVDPSYLGLPYPSLNPERSGKTVIVYGGSSSVGTMATQLAVASGASVISITSSQNAEFSKRNGAGDVFDYKDPDFVDKVAKAVGAKEGFVGILDAISTPETYSNDLAILDKLGGGVLACTHLAPEDVPDNVKAKMIFPVTEITHPVWENFITPALESGQLKCLPKPLVVGKGLEYLQEALDKNKAGVSATKLVVEV